MAIVFDTTVLIEYERGRIGLRERMAARVEDACFLSVISASELLHGVHRATSEDVKARREAFVENILAEFPLLPVDLAAARVHARLSATLAASGVVVGSHDRWIASQCIVHGFTLATSNLRDFVKILGLSVEQW